MDEMLDDFSLRPQKNHRQTTGKWASRPALTKTQPGLHCLAMQEVHPPHQPRGYLPPQKFFAANWLYRKKSSILNSVDHIDLLYGKSFVVREISLAANCCSALKLFPLLFVDLIAVVDGTEGEEL